MGTTGFLKNAGQLPGLEWSRETEYFTVSPGFQTARRISFEEGILSACYGIFMFYAENLQKRIIR